MLNKIREWFALDERRPRRRWPTGTSPRCALLRHPHPRRTEDKYFYVWLDAPVGYLASLKNLLRQDAASDFDAFLADPALEQVHFIGKDIIYFHTLFWPAMLHFSGRKTPDHVFVHGFITVSAARR